MLYESKVVRNQSGSKRSHRVGQGRFNETYSAPGSISGASGEPTDLRECATFPPHLGGIDSRTPPSLITKLPKC